MSESHPVINALLTRRSVRFGFDERRVPREVIERVVACGLAAPSSKNAQPWRFHVVSERSLLDHLSRLVSNAKGIASYVPHDPRTGRPYSSYKSTVLESAVVLLDVPAAIWVENLGSFSVGRKTLRTVPAETLADSLEGYGFELIGIGAAIENMWIAANALGLSAAFIGDVVVAESKIAEVLGLRGDLVGVLALGYSSSEPRPPMDVPTFDHLDRVVWHQGVVR